MGPGIGFPFLEIPTSKLHGTPNNFCFWSAIIVVLSFALRMSAIDDKSQISDMNGTFLRKLMPFNTAFESKFCNIFEIFFRQFEPKSKGLIIFTTHIKAYSLVVSARTGIILTKQYPLTNNLLSVKHTAWLRQSTQTWQSNHRRPTLLTSQFDDKFKRHYTKFSKQKRHLNAYNATSKKEKSNFSFSYIHLH